MPGSMEKSRESCWHAGRLGLPGNSLSRCCSVVPGGMSCQGLLLLPQTPPLIPAWDPIKASPSWDSFSS